MNTTILWHIYHIVPISFCPGCENSRLWVLPIVYWISHIWRFDYEHNYIKVVQLRPPVMKMVIGSINWAQGNRIMPSFLLLCLLKIAYRW